MLDACPYIEQGAKDMPHARHVLSVLAGISRWRGQRCVWWHPS